MLLNLVGWLNTLILHDVFMNKVPEFIGNEFQQLLSKVGIKLLPTSAWNPQGNSIDEVVHKSVGAVLYVLIHLRSPQTCLEAQAVVKQALLTAMHVMCCASHGSLLNLPPGAVAFRRDMFLDIPLISDVLTVQEARQEQVDQCVLWANALRFSHDWNVNDQAPKHEPLSLSNEMKPEWTGPYIVDHVHANGTCTIWLKPNVTEWLNIRWIKPFKPS